jgi:hypothetical protein
VLVVVAENFAHGILQNDFRDWRDGNSTVNTDILKFILASRQSLVESYRLAVNMA